MKNGFGITYQDLEKEGFRLDLSCDRAALQSPPYMRRDCVTLPISVLVKKRKRKEEGREGERNGGRKEEGKEINNNIHLKIAPKPLLP